MDQLSVEVSRDPPKPSVTVWTSSHGSSNRYLRNFTKNFFNRQSRFQSPWFDSVPGRKMTPDLVTDILNDIRQRAPHPQLHLLMMGDNNLRHSKEDPREVSRMLMDIVNEARNYQRAYVIVSTLMPSIENINKNNQIFLDFDKDLKKVLNPRVEVLDLGKSLRTKQGAIKEHLFEDQVHLNQTGAYVVAEQIYDKVMHTPKNFL